MIDSPRAHPRDAASGVGRREFLRMLALGAGAVAVGSCARARGPVAPATFASAAPQVAATSEPGLRVFLGASEFVAGMRQRVPLGLVGTAGETLLERPARVWIGAGTQAASGPVAATFHRYAHVGDGDPIGFYEATLDIPDAGIVDVMVETAGLYGFTVMQPVPRAIVGPPGEPAIAVATPTLGHPRGVKNICTRDPICPMHTERLDEALTRLRPVVFSIASPLLCTSRTCGPVVDEIIDVRAEHRARASFIHAEVYRGQTATVLSPTSRRWGIDSEPWTFVIDAAGIVRARFEGPVSAAEIDAALRPLL